MPSTFRKGSDMRGIIRTLPRDQLQHLSRVGLFVRLLTANICGCDSYPEITQAEEYRYFGDAAFYHDIGKAWVPVEILLKPGKLTAEETHLVRRHTLLAEELFGLIDTGSISGMPEHLICLARDSAVYHHEWWNGQGYPYGLSQEEIPLVARITSICDVYDAITSNRPYRKAHSHAYACREIEANAGAQFDPVIAQIFLDYKDSFQKI